MRPRVYVTQPIAASAAKRLREIARVTINADSSRPLPKKNLLAAVRKTDILFSLLHDGVDREVLAANPKLRAVASMAITPDAIDVKAATARGIPVTVVPPIVGETTADLNFGLMIAVARRMREGDRFLRKGGFPGGQSNHFAGSAVSGKVLGLIGGGGRIGRAVARRAHGFSMEVLYWSPRRKPPRDEEDFGIVYVPFEELLARSDFVSLHPPLNEETRHMISDRELALMKPTAFLINTARGPIVDEAALIRALAKKRIAGAGLDVYEHEPKVAMALRKMSNVVLTPHMGSAVASVREVMANIVVDNIVAILDGKPPPNCINPQVLK
jgi:glyoxylate reductase